MLSRTISTSPSTDVLEPDVASSSSPFSDDNVSSTSLDMRNFDIAESGLTQNRASKPLETPITYWKSLSYSTIMSLC